MLLYGSYMRGIGLKWRCLLFWYILSCFDPIAIINIVPKFKGVNLKPNIEKCSKRSIQMSDYKLKD